MDFRIVQPACGGGAQIRTADGFVVGRCEGLDFDNEGPAFDRPRRVVVIHGKQHLFVARDRAVEDRGQRDIHHFAARVAAVFDDGGDQMVVVQDHEVMVVQSSVHE